MSHCLVFGASGQVAVQDRQPVAVVKRQAGDGSVALAEPERHADGVGVGLHAIGGKPPLLLPGQDAALTRQITLPTSSATSSAPFASSTTPTGRPYAWPSSLKNPVSTSTGGPTARPSTNGTKITL